MHEIIQAIRTCAYPLIVVLWNEQISKLSTLIANELRPQLSHNTALFEEFHQTNQLLVSKVPQLVMTNHKFVETISTTEDILSYVLDRLVSFKFMKIFFMKSNTFEEDVSNYLRLNDPLKIDEVIKNLHKEKVQNRILH